MANIVMALSSEDGTYTVMANIAMALSSEDGTCIVMANIVMALSSEDGTFTRKDKSLNTLVTGDATAWLRTCQHTCRHQLN